jgi:hypothetical protein
MKMDATLQEKGYTQKERGKIYKKVRHPWLPRKVLAMLWLTMEGLPIGAWHTRIGHQRICNLCDDGVLETLEHGLMKCVVVEEAWSKFKELRVKYALVARHSSWEDILLGELQPPCNEVTNEEEIKWDIGKSYIITLSTPWIFLSPLYYLSCSVRNVNKTLKKDIFA